VSMHRVVGVLRALEEDLKLLNTSALRASMARSTS
jgi:hypothetical protein